MKKIVVLLTACLLMICTVLSVAAQATEQAADQYADLDYRTGANGGVSVPMGDVLSQLGVGVTKEEKDYIYSHFDWKYHALQYTRPDAYVDHELTRYDAEAKCLELIAQDDFHENESNGNYLIWEPHTATIGEMSAAFVPAPDLGDSYYRAMFENIEWSASMDVTIDYHARLTLSAETLNAFVNFAYDGAVSLENEKTAYEQALAAYNQSVQDWNNYNEASARYEIYQEQVDLYHDYCEYQTHLASLAQYNAAYRDYLEREQAWTDYQLQSAKYQAYVRYKDVDYPQLLAEYQRKMATVNQHLYFLSLLEEVDPQSGVSFVEMMIDDRVAQKITEYRSIIVIIPNVKGSTLDQIKASTDYLKKFCANYSGFSTDRAKYEYYIKEHANFAYHLRKLYDSTQELYKVDDVYDLLLKLYPQYVDRMKVMLGALYVQDCVFNDSLDLKLNHVVDFRTKKTAAMLVDESVRPKKDSEDTNNATPLAAWPEAPIDPDTYEVKVEPQEPEKPRMEQPDPNSVYQPQYKVVSNGGELEPDMQEPTYMEQPVQPSPMPAKPTQPTWTEQKQALYDAYVAGQIERKELFAQDQIYTLSDSVSTTVYLDLVEVRYFVTFYNTDAQGTRLGRSAGVLSGQQAIVPDSAKNPTKPGTVKETYEFIGWVDAQGAPADLTHVTQDMNVYASYRAIPKTYVVTWMVDGVATEQELEYGQTPVFEGTTDKAPDAQFIYTFEGWDKPITPVTGNVTYTAQYSMSEQRYTAIFEMGDGSSDQKEYKYGTPLKDIAIRTPYKAPDAQFTYTFKGWRDDKGTLYTNKADLPDLTENMHFVAEFDATVNQYTITWMVDGVATQGIWNYGDMPSFNGTPSRETDERYHYTFADWDKEVSAVTGDATYVATFDREARYYRITFIVEGVEHHVALEYDQMPTFESPTKESDAQYHYTFSGWDTDLSPVREDTVYTARFISTLRQYTVTFIVEGEEIVYDVSYGDVPRYRGETPIKPDDALHNYVFTGWDKEIVAVDGSEAKYTAVFEAIPLIPANGAAGQLSVLPDGGYELKIEGDRMDISLILERAGKTGASSLKVLFGDAELVFSKEQIDAFYLMGEGISTISLSQLMHEDQPAYRIEMRDAEGEQLSFLLYEIALKLPYTSENTTEVYRVEADGKLTKIDAQYKDGFMEFSTVNLATYVLVQKYKIEKAPLENGTFDVVGEAYEGDVITFTPDADEGYLVDSVKVECNGEQIKVEAVDGVYSFTMPKGNVQISATFAQVQGGTGAEVIVGVVTALLIVAIGFIIAFVLLRRKATKA